MNKARHHTFGDLLGIPLTFLSRRLPDTCTRVLLHLHRPLIGNRWIPITHDGFRLFVNPQDNCGGRLYYWGYYERQQTEAIKNLIHELRPATFLDVGSNIGYYTIMAAHSGVPNVISVEASPSIYARLVDSIALNRGLESRVRLIQGAVSDHDGEIDFWTNENPHNFGLGSVSQSVGSSQRVTVPCITIDSLCLKRQPLLCKIDVEGGEWDVLVGMSETTKTIRPTFLLEVHPNELRKRDIRSMDVLELLWKYGYRITKENGDTVLDVDNLPDYNFWAIARPSQ